MPSLKKRSRSDSDVDTSIQDDAVNLKKTKNNAQQSSGWVSGMFGALVSWMGFPVNHEFQSSQNINPMDRLKEAIAAGQVKNINTVLGEIAKTKKITEKPIAQDQNNLQQVAQYTTKNILKVS